MLKLLCMSHINQTLTSLLLPASWLLHCCWLRDAAEGALLLLLQTCVFADCLSAGLGALHMLLTMHQLCARANGLLALALGGKLLQNLV